MLIILSLTSISQALSSKKCECTQILNKNDCSSLVGKCRLFDQEQQSKLICGYYQFTPNCPFFETMDDCDNQDGCAWTKDNQCSKFSQCSDYAEYNYFQCYLKNPACIPVNKIDDGSRNCIEGSIPCEQMINKKICNLMNIRKTSRCYWKDKCIEQDFSKCSTITIGELCQSQSCIFDKNLCRARKCIEITTQTECTSIRDDDPDKVQLCTWKENTCQDAVDVSNYNSPRCFVDTGGSYQYNTEKKTCEPCYKEETDFTTLIIALSVSLPIGLLIIIGFALYLRKKRLQTQTKNYQLTRPISIYKDIMMDEASKQKLCSICTNIFQDDTEVTVTQCLHIFHCNCLTQWLVKNKDCPFCHSVNI